MSSQPTRPEIEFPGDTPPADLVVEDLTAGDGPEYAVLTPIGLAGGDQGIAGMRVGGRRRLAIPPRLAYGERGAGGAIAPGETLIFVVDLMDVR